MKQPISSKVSVQQEKMQTKKSNAASSSVPDNDSKLKHGEDVSPDKQSHTGEDLKAQYAFRMARLSLPSRKLMLHCIQLLLI